MKNGRNIIVFGTGKIYERKKKMLEINSNINIVAIFDNNIDKIGTYVDGKQVVHPDMIMKIEFDYVIIMSNFIDDMKSQLMSLSVPETKILTYDNIHLIDDVYTRNLNSIKDCVSSKKYGDNMIALFFYDLSITGSPIVALYLAKILKKLNFYPIVISYLDGPLRAELHNYSIPIIIENNANLSGLASNILLNARFGIANNLLTHIFIRQITVGIKMYWWIHEAESHYMEEEINFLQAELNNSVKVLAVSNYAKQIFNKYLAHYQIDVMHFGIPDKAYKEKHGRNSKIVLGIVGTICKRKGQDILLKAIENLNKKDYNKIEVHMIGEANNSEFKEIIKSYLSDNVKLSGLISPENIEQIYGKLDVLICCSRDEPMPTVIVEGLMFSKICIVSSNIGMADYIEDGVNGFKYDNPEDFNTLRDKISWVINNHDKLDEIRKNARKTYLRYFTMEVFEKRIKEIFKINDNEV